MSQLNVRGLEVEVVRKRVKRVNLRVRRDGSVVVSAPARVGLDDIASFVALNEDWIRERQADRIKTQKEECLRWQDGGVITLFGDSIILSVRRDVASQATSFAEREGMSLLVHVSRRATGATLAREVKRVATGWMTASLEEALPPLFAQYESLLDVRCSGWTLKRMTSRWGSCNVKTGRIVINSVLAERPHECLETVVAHELCHLLEPSHNARFHALLDSACPQNRTAQAYLNAHPPVK